MKTVYVPTGQIRRPEVGEYFSHPRWQSHRDPYPQCADGVDGSLLVRCVIPDGCPDDGEIYEAIRIKE